MNGLFENQISVWQALRESPEPVVLYGMGDGADKVLAAFEKYGITAAGVMASDGFVRGQQFHGFTVKRLSDFEKEYGDFTIALCFASQLPEVMATIKSAASRHRLLVPSVPAFGDVLFDDDFISAHLADMEAAYALLADEQSRAVYKNVLRFYHTGDIALLDAITTPKDEAFDDILKLGRAETYADLGAYNGDTVDEFLHFTGGEYREMIALEPNAKNFKKPGRVERKHDSDVQQQGGQKQRGRRQRSGNARRGVGRAVKRRGYVHKSRRRGRRPRGAARNEANAKCV